LDSGRGTDTSHLKHYQPSGWESAKETVQDVSESFPRGMFVQGVVDLPVVAALIEIWTQWFNTSHSSSCPLCRSDFI